MDINFKSLLGDSFPIIEKYAPAVASAIGGPLAGKALSALILLGNYFGVSKPLNSNKIKTTILEHPNPDQVLSKLSDNFDNEMLQLLKDHFPKEIDLEEDVKF